MTSVMPLSRVPKLGAVAARGPARRRTGPPLASFPQRDCSPAPYPRPPATGDAGPSVSRERALAEDAGMLHT